MKTAILPLPGQEKANKYHPKRPGGKLVKLPLESPCLGVPGMI